MTTLDYRSSHTAPDKGRTYDEDFRVNRHRTAIWRLEKRALDKIVAERFGGKKFRLLDFACGTGRILSHLEVYASESTGVDLSKAMLEVARSKVKSSEIIEADITREDELEGRQFDMISAFRFFPNAEPALRLEAMKALSRRLVPGGTLVFNNHKNADSAYVKVARALGRLNPNEVLMSTKDSYQLVADSGLEVVKRFHMGIIPISEKNTLVPSAALHFSERLLSHIRPLRELARYHIYVCQKPKNT